MNWRQDLFGIDAEVDRMRRLRREGRPLPYRTSPGWLFGAKPTPVGFYRLPHEPVTDGMAGLSGTIGIASLKILLSGFFLLSTLKADRTNTVFEMTLLKFVAIVAPFFAVALVLNHLAAEEMRPESATLQVAPGETLLLMFKTPPGRYLPEPRLVLQERWKVQEGKRRHWKHQTLLDSHLTFELTGTTLRTLHVAIPEDALESYDSGTYKLQWSIAIRHMAWYGLDRIEHYVFWVERR